MADFDNKAKNWDGVPGRAERANAVAAAIREQVRLSKTMTALEYGCGTGLLSFALQRELGAITLADSSTGMLEVLKEKIARGGIINMASLRLDLAADPLPAERFNLVYTLMTLHHIPDTAKILASFYSLLQPGGVLCIFDGHNGFDRKELGKELEKAGFNKVRFTTCYTLMKDGRPYPLFLSVAEKK